MRFRAILCVLALALAVTLTARAQAPAAPKMTVYKSPTCGCCAKWVAHMRNAGFDLTVNDVQNVGEIKAQHHVPADAQSCHTALVGGYVVEGHVPADVVKQLLKEKPAVAGLAVPGMPIGSPGMESADGNKQAYNVLSFDKAGKTQVYAVR
jgi:Predicted metal-binding protein